MTSNEIELQKVTHPSISPFRLLPPPITNHAQLYANLSNAQSTYGKDSRPALLIQSMITDYINSSSSASSSAAASAESSPKTATLNGNGAGLPTFQNLVLRPKRAST
jgi:hypothetical protein